jgi:REP element-mobilizing transposase RayT
MPHHIHALLIFVGAGFPRPNNQTLFQNKSNKKPMSIIDNQKCTDLCDDKRNKGRGDPAPTLGQIIGYFKYGTTKQINLMLNAPGKQIWQRNYYEHIIRDESDLHDTREYIVNNPYGWEKDEYYS